MSVAHPHRPGRSWPERERSDPGSRLVGSEAALRAIQRGEIDAVLVAGRHGTQVFTLEGTGHTYRVLVESMNEGALTVSTAGVILYANQRFAGLVKTPLEQVQGGSLLRFLAEADRPTVLAALGQPAESGAKLQLQLVAGDGSPVPVHISLRGVPLDSGGTMTQGLVVTDMSEVRRAEQMLRTFAHIVVRAQDLERERVSGELHDNISQRLCGLLVRWRVFADKFPALEGALKDELAELTAQLGEAALQVQQLSTNLHAHGLAVMGLIPAVRGAVAEFETRTRLPVRLGCPDEVAPTSAAADVALYRILQEALDNVERHARASRVEVDLVEREGALHLRVGDDGVGFRLQDASGDAPSETGFGVVAMSERARSVGGTFELASQPGAGTTITVSVPLAPLAPLAADVRSAG
jgi:two-component system NarL family sensor kinase